MLLSVSSHLSSRGPLLADTDAFLRVSLLCPHTDVEALLDNFDTDAPHDLIATNISETTTFHTKSRMSGALHQFFSDKPFGIGTECVEARFRTPLPFFLTRELPTTTQWQPEVRQTFQPDTINASPLVSRSEIALPPING